MKKRLALDGATLTDESLRQVLKNGYADKAEIKKMFQGFALDATEYDSEDQED